MDESRSSPERLVAAVPDSLPLDDTLSALADAERRHLLAKLGQIDTPERLSSLTRWLAADADRTEDVDVSRLYVRLHHIHVPKLADVGIVSYDDETDAVELTEQGRPLADAISV